MRLMKDRLVKLALGMSVASLMLGVSTTSQAFGISNGGFELGTGVGNANNATDWSWSPTANGERVNALTASSLDNGDGTSGTHLIDPYADSWFGYAENSGAIDAGPQSAQFSQSVTIDPANPVLTFWWRFFTAETPGTLNTFNDRFQVDVEGSLSLVQTIATVNGTSMISTGGPLWTPILGSPSSNPGQNQSFGLYTPSWVFYSLNASSMAGETVSVYFRVQDAGGQHNQSSGYAVDNIQFVPVPEPAVMGMALLGGLLIWRRRQ